MHEPIGSETAVEHFASDWLSRAPPLGFERLWPALWPALAVLSGFLIVSLLGLWALAAGLAARARAGWRSPAAWCGRCGARAQRDALAGPGERARPAGAGQPAAASAAALARRPAVGRRRAIPATLLLWRRHQERLRAHAARAEDRAAALRPAAARSLGVARGAAAAAGGRAGRGRQHGAAAAGPGVRAATAPAASPRHRSS